CRVALKDAGLDVSKIDEVILVGGQTRMPLVQKTVAEFFGKDPRRDVNPDEAVAVGAAIQGQVLGGERKDVLLLDVTPLTLGIETLGGVMTPMIPRNTTIPTRKSEVFSTAADGQTTVEVVVTQGERPMARDNKILGRFHLEGIMPAPRGMPQIEVTFDIDANGLVNVSAKDKGTGKEQKITITGSSGLTESEIQRMVKDAESHEADDKSRREAVEARNHLDNAIYQAEKLITDNRDKIQPADRAEVEREIESAKKVLESNREAKDAQSATALKEAEEKLKKSLYKIGEMMYRNAQGAQGGAAPGEQQQAPGGATGGKKDDGVIDAEFTEESK
ncbi:MAG: molecular chaperone DnaK, partial [Nevskiaceae bacterium]